MNDNEEVFWDTSARSQRHRSLGEFRTRSLLLRLRDRVDAVLIGGIVGGIGLLMFVWFGLWQLAERFDWFEPGLIEPLADDRILTNVRDDLDRFPILDGVWHSSEGKLYVSKAGGVIHIWDPDTGLWREERPFLGSTQIRVPDFTILRSGCGHDPATEEARNCPDPGALWAVTEVGALAMKKNGRWQVVAGDTDFIGASGNPVDHSQLTAAAISDDQTLLVLGTRDDGIGVYDIRVGAWWEFAVTGSTALPSLSITHVVYWQGRFWIGTSRGLVSMSVSESSSEIGRSYGIAGRVLDLDADESLWALQSRPCENGDADCLWMGKLTSVDETQMVTLLNERFQFQDLSFGNLSFVQQWTDWLVVAGEVGIFTYDLKLHTWSKVSDAVVNVTLPSADGRGFWFGHTKGAGFIAEGWDQTFQWDLNDEPVIQLLQAGSDILARTSSGNVYSLDSTGSVGAVHATSRTRFDPAKLTSALAFDDTVLLFGPRGVVIHDIVRRRFEDVSSSALPPWFTDPGTRFFEGVDVVYALGDADTASPSIYTIAKAALKDAQSLPSELTNPGNVVVSGPITNAWGWGQSGVGFLTADGSMYFIDDQLTPVRLIGNPFPFPGEVEFLDVLDNGTALFAATKKGLFRYDLSAREWSDVSNVLGGEIAVELAQFGSTLLVRSDANRLVSLPVNAASVGGLRRIQISDERLSDAVLVDDHIYMAGEGRVEKYSLEDRKWTSSWETDSRGPLAIEAVLNGVPLTLGAGRAFLGATEIEPEAGRVLSVSVGDGRIWTVREQSGERYLKSYDQSNIELSKSCLFRTSVAVGATEVLDARLLPGRKAAVVSDVGLHFYELDNRTWRTVDLGAEVSGARVYILGNYFVLVREDPASGLQERVSVHTIRLDSMPIAENCDTGPLTINPNLLTAVSVSVNEAMGTMALLHADGSIETWRNGAASQILDAVDPAPDPSVLQRVFHIGDYLFITAQEGIWRYDLNLRSWHQITWQNGPSALVDINIEADGSLLMVTAKDENQEYYVGQFDPEDSFVRLMPVTGQITGSFGLSGDSLLDVQKRGDGLWTFVVLGGIKYFDPRARTWKPEGVLGAADPSLSYQEAFGRGIAVGNQGNRWWIARQAGSAPQEFARFDLRQTALQTALGSNGRVWSLDGIGDLKLCTAQDTNTYQCQTNRVPVYMTSPDTVQFGFIWDGLHVFQDGNRLRFYDPDRLAEFDLSQDLPGIPTQIRRFGSDLWFIYPQNVVMLRPGPDRPNLKNHDGVLKLVLAGNRTLWAFTSDGWLVFDGENFGPATTTGGTSALREQMLVYVEEDGMPVAVGPDGVPYVWRNGRFDPGDVPFPPQIDLSLIRGMWMTPTGNWWVRIGEKNLMHVVRANCSRSADPSDSTDSTSSGPTPVPPPVPCFRVGSVRILPENTFVGEHPIEQGSSSDDGLILVLSTGKRLVALPDVGGSAGHVEISDISLPIPVGIVTDQWTVMSRNARQLADGRWAYNPIVTLSLDGFRLVAERPLSVEFLDSRGAFSFNQPAPLDVGWLVWDRGARGFTVRTPTGFQNFAAADFVVGGRLLFEQVDAVLAMRTDLIFTANRSGIWSFGNEQFRLDDPRVTFKSVQMTTPIAAAHGRFIDRFGAIEAVGQGNKTPLTIFTTVVEDVTLSEPALGGKLNATYRVGGNIRPAFASEGFIWDSGRRSVAFEGGQITVLSDAGIHPAVGYTNFELGPASVTLQQSELQSENGGLLHLEVARTWFRRNGSAWSSNVPDPAANRTLLSQGARTWSLRNGKFAMSLRGSRFDAAYGRQGSGYGFNSDLLRAASWHDGKLFVMTDAFIESGDPSSIADMSAQRFAPRDSDKLDPIVIGGTPILFNSFSSLVSAWDQFTRQFVPVGSQANPYRNRELLATRRIRMSLEPDGINKETLQESLSGSGVWVSFDFDDGRFPFDVVTALAADRNRVYVGTAAGLQIFRNLVSLRLDNALAVYGLAGTRSGPRIVPILRIGTPTTQPNLLMAKSAMECIQTSDSRNFTPCDDPDSLDIRLRVNTPLWYWTVTGQAFAEGRYKDNNGVITLTKVDVRRRRLTHDRIVQGVTCEGSTQILWEQDWITVSWSGAFALNNLLENQDVGTLEPARLVCVSRGFVEGNHTVSAGLYVEDGEGRYHRWNQGAWSSPETDPGFISLLSKYADTPPVLQRGRFRLPEPNLNNPVKFEQRSTDDFWNPIPWLDGQLTLDSWNAIAWDSGKLQVSTPEGIVHYQRNRTGQAVIDPDNLLIVRSPVIDSRVCNATEMMMTGASIMIRCDGLSSQVYQGKLDPTRDTADFRRQDQDTFAETDLITKVNSDYWSWLRVDRVEGRPGHLEASLRGELLQLVAGRFSFDNINSIALYEADRIELGSDPGGWFTSSRSSLHVSQIRRPTPQDFQPSEVLSVGIGKEGDGLDMCLKISDGFLRISNTGEVKPRETCPEYLGQDRLWRYAKNGDTVHITTFNSFSGSGSSARILERGKFRDDIIIGPPATFSDDGNVNYLIPTRAGILQVDAELRDQKLHAPPFVGLAEGSVPLAVLTLTGRDQVYAGNDGFYPLSNSRIRIDELPNWEPVGSMPTGVHVSVNDNVTVSWESPGVHVWRIMDLDGRGSAGVNALHSDVSKTRDFLRARKDGVQISASVWTLVWDDRLVFNSTSLGTSIEVRLSIRTPILEAMQIDNRLILIYDSEMYDVNLSEVVELLVR